jgi:acyl carrier protein
MYDRMVEEGTVASGDEALSRKEFEQVVSIVAGILVQDNRPVARLTLDSDFIVDLGFDSLECVEAADAVEEELHVVVTDDDLLWMHTLRDVVSLILTQRGRRETLA